jgi:hypothetical protein
LHRFATAIELADAFTAAVRGRLDHTIIKRAEVVLYETPWGAWVSR